MRYALRSPAALIAVGALALTATGGRAQDAKPGNSVASPASIIAAMPKNLPRAKGPGLDVAIAAAQAAHKACVADNVKVSVLIADSVGAPVVLLSGDGAGVRSALIAKTKVAIVAKYKVASGDVATKAEHDPNLTAEAAADPEIGVLRGGGFPVVQAGQIVGIVGVSGGSLGGVMGLDEKCAMVAVKYLQAH